MNVYIHQTNNKLPPLLKLTLGGLHICSISNSLDTENLALQDINSTILIGDNNRFYLIENHKINNYEYGSVFSFNGLKIVVVNSKEQFLKSDLIIYFQIKPFRFKDQLNLTTDIPFIYVSSLHNNNGNLYIGGSFIQGTTKLYLEPFTTGSLQWEYSKLERPIIIDIKYVRTDYDFLLKLLVFATCDYLETNNLNNLIVGLSGGIDSAVALFIATLTKKNVIPVFMPGPTSRPLIYDTIHKLTSNLKIPLIYIPIKFTYNVITNIFDNKLTNTTSEKMLSRLKTLILETMADDKDALILNTTNLTEFMTERLTLSPTSKCLNILGGLFKTEIYALANFINSKYNQPFEKELLDESYVKLGHKFKDIPSQISYQQLDLIISKILNKESLSNEELLLSKILQSNSNMHSTLKL